MAKKNQNQNSCFQIHLKINQCFEISTLFGVLMYERTLQPSALRRVTQTSGFVLVSDDGKSHFWVSPSFLCDYFLGLKSSYLFDSYLRAVGHMGGVEAVGLTLL